MFRGSVLQAFLVVLRKSAELRLSSMDSGNGCQAVVRTLEPPHSTYPNTLKCRDHHPFALHSPLTLDASCCFAQAEAAVLAADVDRRTTLNRRAAPPKAAASSSSLRRPIEAQRRTL